MMKKRQFSLIIILFISVICRSQSYTISGYVSDQKTMETLIGAIIHIQEINKGAVTDNNGFFSLPGIKTGEYTLIISHLGYEQLQKKITIENHGLVLKDLYLVQMPFNLEEVSIVALKPDRVGDKTIETSQIELTPQMIRSIPTAGNDVFAAAKYLPGINRTEPNSPLYTVRGGDPGENAVMLDGVMIYNPYHSSITSGIFNTMSIKNVDLLVGGFGAEFGGRNSSVMYITTIDGNLNEFHGEIEPSTFYSKIFLEFPAGKNASMMVAGRYLFDVPFNFLFNSQNYFYDYNLSYTNRINNRNRITLKYFESKDFTGYNFNTFYRYLDNTINTDIYDNFILKQRNNWKNKAATLIHKMVLTPRIYIRNQVYYSSHASKNLSGLDFKIDFPEENGDTASFQWTSNSRLKSQIVDLSVKSAVQIKLADFDELHIGIEYNNYSFENGIILNEINNGTFSRYPSLLALFAENKITTSVFTFRPGVRFSNYRNNEWLYEPRFNLSVNLPGKMILKLAYGEYLQYIISMNSNEIEMNQIVDYYYPLWDNKPSKSIHYIAGISKNISSTLTLSIDYYYKEIPNIYSFDLNNYFGITDRLQQGKGRAYGFEMLLNGKIKNISGWLSYSYSKAYRHYPGTTINEGNEYVFDYTRPHTVKSVVSMQLNSNFSLNASFQYLAGLKRSIETTTQSYYYYDPINNTTTSFPIWTTNEKNSAKMPPIITMDLGIRKKLLSGFGKQLAELINADESYITVTIRNILFFYRNVDFYFPGAGIPGYNDKYIPIGSNYLPSVGFSYTLKF